MGLTWFAYKENRKPDAHEGGAILRRTAFLKTNHRAVRRDDNGDRDSGYIQERTGYEKYWRCKKKHNNNVII